MRKTEKKTPAYKEVSVEGKEINVWSFINSITFDKKTEYTDETKSVYSKFMINRALSMFPDTVVLANEMNLYSDIPDESHYAFLINIVKPKKRFSKWPKKAEDAESDIAAIQKFYGYNEKKAKSVLPILGDEGIAIIRKKQEKGGE